MPGLARVALAWLGQGPDWVDMARKESPAAVHPRELEPLAVPLIDTHCHLSNGRFDADREDVIAALPSCGLAAVMCIATGLEDAMAVRALVARHPQLIFWSVGLDPFSCCEAGADFPAALAGLRRLLDETMATAQAPRALGEIGLEYFHALNAKPVQAEQLALQLDLAAEFSLPVVIHCRDAFDDLYAVLRDHPRNQGIIHSFIGPPEHARAWLDLGWHLSFNGTVTYPANQFLRDAAALVPADRLLIETDAPYLPPVPWRGRRCEPALVRYTVECLAEVRGERPDDIAAWTTRNACKLLNIPLPWSDPEFST